MSDEVDYGNRAISRMSADVMPAEVFEYAKLSQTLGVPTLGDKSDYEVVARSVER